VFGLFGMALRFAWLAIMVLGIRQAIQMAQRGVDELVLNIEQGQQGGAAGAIIRLHEALLQRPATSPSAQQSGDGPGES